MINKLIISVFILLTSYGRAQELSISGQSNLQYYNRTIERLKKMSPATSRGYNEMVADAESKIASIKISDPSYNVSAMEEEINKYKKQISSTSENKNDVMPSSENLDKELSTFLTWSIGNYKDIKTPADYDNIEKKVNEEISLFSDFCKNKLANAGKKYQSNVEAFWNHTGSDDTKLTSTINYYQTSEEGTLYSYYQTKWLSTKWKLLGEIYPDSKVVQKAIQKADQAMKIVGSVEDAKKQGENSKAKRIAETKMDPAVVNDPELEAMVKKAVLNTKFAAGKTVMKVNIHSKNWAIQKHPVTGITLSRTKSYSAGLKDKEGKCYLLHYSDFKQDYVGGTFVQGYINLGEVVEILCENIK